MMISRARLFVASWDEMLLRSRTMMLGAYFSVQPAGRFSEGVQLIRRHPYDLLVLCHTLSDDEQEFLSRIARAVYAPVEVLALHRASQKEKPYANHLCDVSKGPWELVKMCAQIVGYRIKSKAKPVLAAR